ncbi:MAG: acetyl-CoA carboxylase biotin carboxyl carrier protein subunit [Clostridia bacterium]|nr:acetyl-CoA carboxylase biotin carboxyl carrier protein subunit [Clostridia bacterium]
MRKFMVTIEGKQYEVGVEEIGVVASTPVVTEVKPAPVATPVSAPAPTAPAKVVAPASPINGTKMEAPMPGMIKAYKVQEGATVKEGDVVLVLEAMKMDNDITAPCSGTVSFKVAVGSNVETGDVMAVIS